MTQPPSPSAAALRPCPFCGEAVQPRDALWPSEGDQDAVIHVEPSDCPMQVFSDGTWGGGLYGRWNGGIDATIERAVTAQPKTLVSVCPHPAKCEEMLEAAERTKPAASDHEAAKALRRELELLGIDMHRNIADSRVPDILAAALAERGERERERAAKIAEEYWRDGRSGFGVAGAIRNQTGD